jgi:hypothetical protein
MVRPLAKHKVVGSTPITRSRRFKDLAARRRAPRPIRCRFGAGSSPGWRVQRPHRRLALYLTNAVRLGTFCAYALDKPTPWTL